MNMLNRFCYLLMFAFVLTAFGCETRKPEYVHREIKKDTLAIPSVKSTTQAVVNKDDFTVAVDSLQKLFPNYLSQYPNVIDTMFDYSEHWLFSIIEKNRIQLERRQNQKLLRKLPAESDYSKIHKILRTSLNQKYKTNNDYVLEKWVFENAEYAEYWRIILSDSLRRNEFTKPPRYQWTNGNDLYLVSTRSAQQWFEHGEKLIKLVSGKTRRQLELIRKPIDLRRFKSSHGWAHSSPINNQEHLYAQDSGIHYSYFYFKNHRLNPDQRKKAGMEFPSSEEFRVITFVPKKLTGEEQFLTIKETLVEIRSSIKDPELGTLNLVGQNLGDLTGTFGRSILNKKKVSIFGYGNSIIVVNHNNKKIDAFKYMKLKRPFLAADSVNTDLMKKITDLTN